MVLLFLLLVILFPIRFIQLSLPQQTLFVQEQRFDIHWVHSVEKEEWIESYEVKNNHLTLTHTAFKTYGAGVPSDGIVQDKNDGYVHMTINREMEEILLVVSDVVKMTVQFEEQEIPLYELVNDYEEVHIKDRWLPWWFIFK